MHLLEAGILLPAGITALTRLVAEVCGRENARLHALFVQRAPEETAIALRVCSKCPRGSGPRSWTGSRRSGTSGWGRPSGWAGPPSPTARPDRYTACIIDTRSVKTSTNVLLTSRGTDSGKKIVGRERDVATDALCLFLATCVTAASLSDDIIGIRLLDQVEQLPDHFQDLGRRRLQNIAVKRGATLGIDVEVIPMNNQGRGFHVSNAAGSSKAASVGSCSTAAWPATTRPHPLGKAPIGTQGVKRPIKRPLGASVGGRTGRCRTAGAGRLSCFEEEDPGWG